MEQNVRPALTLRILTPERCLVQGEFDSVTLRTVEGELGILPGHEKGVFVLGGGVVRAKAANTVQEYATLGGYASVGLNEVVILTALAETPDKMNEELNRLALLREQNRVAVQKADAELHRAETALRRALVQHEVSAYAVMQGNLDQQVELPGGAERDEER